MILLAVDYVSMWVEPKDTINENAKTVIDFLNSNIFARYGLPRALVSDRGTHFYNKNDGSHDEEYGVTHQNQPPTIHKQMAKPKCLIKKLKKFSRRRSTPHKKIGA